MTHTELRRARATLAQRRFYLLDERAPGSARTLVKRIRVVGPVDGLRLRAAVQTVVEANPAMRVALHPECGDLAQVVHPASDVPVGVQILLDDDVVQAAEKLARNLDLTPLAHSAGPLCRFSILIGQTTAEVVVAVHHAVFDETSAPLLLEALVAAYDHDAVATAPLASDEVLPARERDDEIEYWRAALADVTEATRLPAERAPSPVVLSGAAGRLRLPVPLDVAVRIARAPVTRGMTPYALIVAATAWTVARLSDRSTAVVASVVSRRGGGSDETIQCQQNTVPVRVCLDGARTVGEVADAALEALLTSFEHAYLPVEDILQCAPTELGTRDRGLTEILCTDAVAVTPVERAGRRWTIQDQPSAEVEFPFAVGLVRQTDATIELEIEYHRLAFDHRFVERVGRCLLRALDLLVGAFDRPLAGEPLAPADVRAALAAGDGGPLRNHDALAVVEQISQQCLATPDAVALVATDATFTYGRLKDQVDELAGRLRLAGVRPGHRVAIEYGRCAGLVLAVLAVHRVGAAYVPVDPTLPAARRWSIASRARVAAIVKEVDGHAGPAVGSPPAGASVATEDADDVAYVIYTSGSTGAPKGVAVSQASVAALLTAFEDRCGPLPDAVVAATSLSFDISVLELLWPLAKGRCLVLVDHRELDAAMIPDGSLYQCTPSFARVLLTSNAGRAVLDRLSVLLVGGEALAADLARELVLATRGRVVNCYGPTETTVWSSTWQVEAGASVSIGSPLAGERLAIVDREGRLLPVGCPGELVIAGVGLAFGYDGEAELTADRFRSCQAFGQARTYWTGDRAVLDENGTFRCLGRADAQLKILGHRIEPAEVEAILRERPRVDDALVVAAPTGDALVALVVVRGASDDGPSEPRPVHRDLAEDLRTHCAATLPPAVVPRHYLTVRELPRTSNGKLDRIAGHRWAERLPTRRPASPAARSGGPVLRRIRAVWAELLGADTSDDVTFFELGGSSADLIALRHVLLADYPDLSIADLFRHSTVSSLAAFLEGASPKVATAPTDAARGDRQRSALTGWGRRDSGRTHAKEGTV